MADVEAVPVERTSVADSSGDDGCVASSQSNVESQLSDLDLCAGVYGDGDTTVTVDAETHSADCSHVSGTFGYGNDRVDTSAADAEAYLADEALSEAAATAGESLKDVLQEVQLDRLRALTEIRDVLDKFMKDIPKEQQSMLAGISYLPSHHKFSISCRNPEHLPIVRAFMLKVEPRLMTYGCICVTSPQFSFSE